jgi:hypothetical protein
MKLPVQIRPLTIPKDFYDFWHDYGKCIACRQDIRHEMHLYNHYRKYHTHRMIVFHYYVWYKEFQQWIEVSKYDLKKERATKFYKRPTAVVREVR